MICKNDPDSNPKWNGRAHSSNSLWRGRAVSLGPPEGPENQNGSSWSLSSSLSLLLWGCKGRGRGETESTASAGCVTVALLISWCGRLSLICYWYRLQSACRIAADGQWLLAAPHTRHSKCKFPKGMLRREPQHNWACLCAGLCFPVWLWGSLYFSFLRPCGAVRKYENSDTFFYVFALYFQAKQLPWRLKCWLPIWVWGCLQPRWYKWVNCRGGCFIHGNFILVDF